MEWSSSSHKVDTTESAPASMNAFTILSTPSSPTGPDTCIAGRESNEIRVEMQGPYVANFQHPVTRGALIGGEHQSRTVGVLLIYVSMKREVGER